MCAQGPSDLAWGGGGRLLLIASHDGTLALARFTEEEVGTPVPDAEVREQHVSIRIRTRCTAT
jgi:hypothetical protein